MFLRIVKAIAVVCALLVPAAAAQTTDAAAVAGLRAEDVFRMEGASDPQISPDGARVVYVRRFADVMSDRTYSNLWIVNADGAGHRALTTGNSSDSSPRWSPDGTRIAFLSARDGTPQIFVRWMDTGETMQVSRLTEAPAGLEWSPDGKWLSFAMLVPEAGPRLIQMPRAPEGAKWAEPAMVVDRLVYRFNGPGYLKHGYWHLHVIPADGGAARQITSGPYHHGGVGFRASTAVWSPDSKYLIVSANRRDDSELEPLDTGIWEFEVATGAARKLTDRRGPDGSPAVSPDNRWIAYTGFDDRYQGHQVTKLYLMRRDGREPRLLTAELDRDARAPQWAADSSGVYFMYDDQGNTKLAFQPVTGARRELARDIGEGTSAYGGSGGFSVSRDGAIAFTFTRPDVPVQIALTRAGQPPRMLTRLNETLLAERRPGAVEEIWYTSSKDGRRIHGWIIKPPDFDPAKKYPLILEIHGGPFANYGDRFDIEKQVWAARGYVVLYTNPRGSTSYGEEFGNLIHHAYPGDDFYDLESGVDAAIAKGYVDPEQLYVTGGSGGGVLTCWVIGRSPRYRAAVSAYPVINWYSFVLTADIAAFVAKYWFPGMPWEHTEHYMERSLTSVVGNVKTPTMVITGEEDWRTPMSESEQYYTALKLRGIDSVLVRVPGEPHGIRRRPSHHVSKMLHIVAWFDKYRKAAPAD
jgi:dipeptidyl aminopeptidase/acylaminoacyl peptidase